MVYVSLKAFYHVEILKNGFSRLSERHRDGFHARRSFCESGGSGGSLTGLKVALNPLPHELCISKDVQRSELLNSERKK